MACAIIATEPALPPCKMQIVSYVHVVLVFFIMLYLSIILVLVLPVYSSFTTFYYSATRLLYQTQSIELQYSTPLCEYCGVDIDEVELCTVVDSATQHTSKG